MSKKQVLTLRERELIAIAASMAGNCSSYLIYLFGEARKAGATLDEAWEAIAIGQAVQAEPINLLRQLAERLLGDSDQAASPLVSLTPAADKKSC